MRMLLALLAGVLLLGACGTIDRCADGLRAPPLGGWDAHGPV